MKPNNLNVSGDGVFFTIQGEGVSMGKPVCFLRLRVCNLKCGWCDTRYAWDTKTPEFWSEKQEWSINKTKKKIEAGWQCKNKKITKRLVITGGEPLLQKEIIDKLIDVLPDWFIEIETNGTVMPTKKMLEYCQFNCSPKLKNSGNPKVARIKGEVLQALNLANSVFKFVVMVNSDIREIEKDFIIPFNLDINKIIIMPEGRSAEEIAKNARQVVEKVKEKGYRLLGRLHCDLWGAKREV
ncbi:7-carboxy-7-deazaguanine synthase QueE [Patescibacteria group bacterium]|nr:7-carboxy-7-deazaguanine synthase QueE [Patescibacteria group bacterium]MBU1499835.1 7-carboxy-7-deazaguanine synthase QueE [Patescibacteria group bacterium]